MNEFFELFIEEVKEHLEILNESLMMLEKQPDDKEVLNKVFRSAHTIKGSSASIGFAKMEGLTHGMEDVLQEIREDKMQIDSKIIELLFICHDLLENCLDSVVTDGNEENIRVDNVLSTLHSIVGQKQKNEKVEKKAPVESNKGGFLLSNSDWAAITGFKENGIDSYTITFNISEECIFKSITAWLILNEVLSLGNVIKADPVMPSEEDFQTGKFTFEESKVIVLLASEYSKETLLVQLNEKLTDIESINIEPLKSPSQTVKGKKKPKAARVSPQTEVISEVKTQNTSNEKPGEHKKLEVASEGFQAEIKEQLEKIESNLAYIESSPGNFSIINVLYKAFRTVKGLAGFMELRIAERICNSTCLLLVEFKKQGQEADSEFIESVLNSLDFIKKVSEDISLNNNIAFLTDVEMHIKYLESMISEENHDIEANELEKAVGEGTAESEDKHEEELAAKYQRDFADEININIRIIETFCDSLRGNVCNLDYVNKLFEAFHSIKGISGFGNQDLIYRIANRTEVLLNDLIEEKVCLDDTVIDAILLSADLIHNASNVMELNGNKEFIQSVENHLRKLDRISIYIPGVEKPEPQEKTQGKPDVPVEQEPISKLGELLLKQGKLTREDITEILRKQNEFYPGMRFGEVAVLEKKVTEQDIIDCLKIQQETEVAAKTAANVEASYIRISASKVENLVDMFGELLIYHSLLEEEFTLNFSENGKLINNLGRMAKIIKDLQNLSLSLRMVSLKTTFQKIMRIGRDTATELKKSIDINLVGEETEIDRTVADKIVDPLMHLVRNSVSHGIESEEERMESGKHVKGLVTVKAYSKKGNVYIEVADDGIGLNIEKIYKKALEKNLIAPGREYSNDEIMKFIFLPGFSTQEVINNISGRGVGMNVVETEIQKLGGKIEIINQPGQGCSFILKIPINLAVTNGTIVNILNGKYILPTIYIKQIVKPKEDQWVSIAGKSQMIKIRDEIIPIIPIWNIFGVGNEENKPAELVVIVESGTRLMALPVSNVLGKQEIVVKPLGSEFKGLNYASGASILGDGRVSLILDIEALFKMSEETEF